MRGLLLINMVGWVFAFGALGILSTARRAASTAVVVGLNEDYHSSCPQIAMFNPATGYIRPIADGLSPVWAPQSDRVVAFACDSPTRFEIFDRRGTVIDAIIVAAIPSTRPAWSADGRYLAYRDVHDAPLEPGAVVDIAQDTRLILYDTHTRQPVFERQAPLSYQWSPQGATLLYPVLDENLEATYFAYAPETGTSSVWYTIPAPLATYQVMSQTTWSDDWRKVIFVPSTVGAPTVLLDTQTGEAIPLPDVELPANGFHWSPDGRWIVYVDYITLMGLNLKDLSLHELSPGQAYSVEGWWPDGSAAVYRGPSNDGTSVRWVNMDSKAWGFVGPPSNEMVFPTVFRVDSRWHPAALAVAGGFGWLLSAIGLFVLRRKH